MPAPSLPHLNYDIAVATGGAVEDNFISQNNHERRTEERGNEGGKERGREGERGGREGEADEVGGEGGGGGEREEKSRKGGILHSTLHYPVPAAVIHDTLYTCMNTLPSAPPH